MVHSINHWTVEAACREAWPAQEEREIGGWLLRLSDTPTRRTNSLNPLSSTPLTVEVIDQVIGIFLEQGKRPIFRIPSFLPDADEILANHGFSSEAPTLTIGAELFPGERHTNVTVKTACDETWLAARQRISGDTDEQIKAFQSVVERIDCPACFVETHVADEIVSIAYGVVASDLLVFESVATDQQARGRGYARNALLSLMDWAYDLGVRQACLQVVADNEPAIALYRKLGFTEYLYSYHYRQKGL